MNFRTIKLLAATAALALTTPAYALPDDSAEMRQMIATEFGGDPHAYVEEERGDFRAMGCRNRADLIQALLDDGLVLDKLSYRAHFWAFYCAWDQGEVEAMWLLTTPDLIAAFQDEQLRKRNLNLLNQGIYWDSYERVRVLLENGLHYFRNDERYLHLTREEHLLLAAYEAVDDRKEDAIRAFQDAGFGSLIEAARNEQNVEYVRARAGLGGGGGGLFRGLATMAAGRAIGGTQGAILETMAKRSLNSDGSEDNQAVAGGPLPLPTGRAELGAQLDLTRQPQGGLRIAAVAVDGPAQAAGLMAGDVITRIAGVPVNSRGSFYVATKKAVDLDTFEIAFRRDGAEQSLQFDPSARVATASDDGQATAREVAPSAQSAASDTEAKLAELERLGDLRDRGILSEEEFEAMKARILGADTKASEGAPNHSDGTPIAEAFGIRRGQSITDLAVIEEQPNGIYKVLPSGSYPDFESIYVVATPEVGVCKIIAQSLTYKDDLYGSAVMAVYNRYKAQFEEQFGPPKEIDGVRNDSTVKDPHEFAWSIWNDDRKRLTYWLKKEAPLPEGYSSIMLRVRGAAKNDLYFLLTHEFSNFSEC
jgi:hypothetical protein